MRLNTKIRNISKLHRACEKLIGWKKKQSNIIVGVDYGVPFHHCLDIKSKKNEKPSQCLIC